MKTIHLRTSKVCSHKDDGTPEIERLIIKLDELSFVKFVNHLHLHNLLKSEPPKVVRVLELKKGDYKDCDKSEFQKIVDEKMKGVGTKKKIDYKKEYEKLQSTNKNLISRLEVLENQSNTDEGLDDLRNQSKEKFNKKPNKK